MEDRQASGAAVLGEAIGGLLGALWTGQAVYRYKDPTTHKIVCRCGCYGPPDKDGQRSGSPQILDEREDCKTLNGIASAGRSYGRRPDGETPGWREEILTRSARGRMTNSSGA